MPKTVQPKQKATRRPAQAKIPAKRSATSPKSRKPNTAAGPVRTPTTAPHSPRRLNMPERIWYKPLSWRHHMPVPDYRPIPKARLILVAAIRHQWAYKKLFGGIAVVYGLLNLTLVRGTGGGSNLSTIKGALDSSFHGIGGHVATSLSGFMYLLVSSGSGTASNASVYQSILLVVCSLAFIWALRQVAANHTVKIKDSFYLGMYPLIPFLLVFLLLGLQLIPLLIGSGLYSLVVTNGIAIHWWEKTLWIMLFASLALWSLRMITASVFALYITTLPDMTPLRAYRSAKQLIYGRRLLIWRKLIFLPVSLLLIAGIIEIPLILFVTPAASWVFFMISMLALPVVHGYLYNLYREML